MKKDAPAVLRALEKIKELSGRDDWQVASATGSGATLVVTARRSS